MRGLRGLATRGLLKAMKPLGPVPARYELRTPEAAGFAPAQAAPVRFDHESSVAVNFNFEPTTEFLTPDDYATFRAVHESFSPEVHAQYHEDAIRWFRRRFPGLTPDPISIERARDRLIIAEHFGPDRQRRYREYLDVVRDSAGRGGEP